MKLIQISPKSLSFNPKHLFKSKDRSRVSRSDPSSFSSSSSDDSVAKQKPGPEAVGSVTPTTVLPQVSGNWSEISADAIQVELVEAFKMIDKDNDGVISKTELEALLSRLGQNPPSPEEMSMMLTDGDRITVEALANRLGGAQADWELRETFQFFDADHDGRISAEELFRVFTSIGDDKCTLDECRLMIARVDKKGDGFVCFDDFAVMMDAQTQSA